MRFTISSTCFCVLFLFLATTVPAQSIPEVGSAGTLDIATWNVEWFGAAGIGPVNDDLQVANVARIISETAIDVWALQEISDADRFESLLDVLGSDWEGQLADISYQQRIGFLYRSNILKNTQIEHVLFDRDLIADTTYFFAGRPPLQLRATVELPDIQFSVLLLTIHAKASNDRTSYDRRAEAAKLIEWYLETGIAAEEKVVFLGDFNDFVEGSILPSLPSPYGNFVADTANYRVLSRNLTCSFIGFNPCSPIDHIIISNDLVPFFVDESARALDEIPSAVSNFENTTSDHLPVVASFMAMPTSRSESEFPEDFSVTSYPNPFSDRVTITIRNQALQMVSLRIYDLLGRKVEELDNRELSPGEHRYSWSGTNELGVRSANGVYILEVRSDRSSFTRPVVLSGF